MNRKKNLLFALIALVLVYLALEALAAVGLWALARWRNLPYEPIPVKSLRPRHVQVIRGLLADAGGFIRLDPELGWEPRPASAWRGYRITEQQLRDDRLYAPVPVPGRPRIAAFGDSFTFGADSKNVYTFEAQMARLEPGIEVLNFGVPAYGLGQAYLRFLRDAADFAPDVVLIGFMSENVFRVVNTFRPFYFAGTASPMAKPRFALDGEELVLIDNPLPTAEHYHQLLRDQGRVLRRMGRNDYHYGRALRPGPYDWLPSVRLVKLLRQHYGAREPAFVKGRYNVASEPYRVTEKVFDAFYRDVRAAGAEPMIVLFPAKGDLGIYRRRNEHKRYQPLIDHFEARGYRYYDLFECFDARAADVPIDDLMASHYSAIGNWHVAHCLLDALRAEGLIPAPDALPPGATVAELEAARDADLAAHATFHSMADVREVERQAILDQLRESWDKKIVAARERVADD